ncbi:MAG TPA: biotin transporter BioY [Acidobacteriaceae bacterium]|jgi:biotin transport system substrate-specific component|nr:biotin transporter BioY [Acidobacteriaceae bacterium]
MHTATAHSEQTLPESSYQRTLLRMALRTGTVVLGTAFLAVCAHIAFPLPFSPVPLTLQTFAVLLIALTFPPAMAGTTLALYLAEGVCGLPVFAPTGPGGMAQLMGPTGGYLLAYPVAAVCAGFVAIRLARVMPRMAAYVVAGICAIVIVLTFGAGWLGVFTHASAAHVAMMAVLPFLPGEAVKIAAAAGIASAWTRLRKQSA